MSVARAPIKLPPRPPQNDIRYRFFAPAYHGYDIESAVFFRSLGDAKASLKNDTDLIVKFVVNEEDIITKMKHR